MTFGLYAYYCYCAIVVKRAIKKQQTGCRLLFYRLNIRFVVFLSIAHAFLQAKSSLHSKQKYKFMRTLYKLLYKKYILKIYHEKRLACATFWEAIKILFL